MIPHDSRNRSFYNRFLNIDEFLAVSLIIAAILADTTA